MGKKRAPWERSSNRHQRKVDTRNIRERFLIVCEGAKTEPNYFKSFRVNRTIFEADIRGFGYNTLSLVNKAIELKAEDDYDQVWCVFDRDSFPAQIFNAAFDKAKREGIKIAYSNEAFELWYLLHFQYYDSAIKRKEYERMLTKLLGHKYEKNSENIYEELIDLQADAIRNAKRLHASYSPRNPERDNPSTTVFELVEALNKFIV
jgi:RloB-like protein